MAKHSPPSIFARHLSNTASASLPLSIRTCHPRRLVLDEIYSIPTINVSSTSSIATWIRSNVPAPLLIGPDAESAQWVAEVALQVQCPYLILEKTRRGESGRRRIANIPRGTCELDTRDSR